MSTETVAAHYCGDPCDPECGPGYGVPWCHVHSGPDPVCADCLAEHHGEI